VDRIHRMDVTTHAPGPTWQPPATSTRGAAPDATRMDTVELLVRDLDTMTTYYHDGVLLDVLDQSGPTATLGRGGAPIMLLRQEKDLPDANRRSAGLYHTAIVFEDQRRLASSLLSVARHAPRTFTGASDHLVSEAFYFTDPEGNGLELYHDRPRPSIPYAPPTTMIRSALARSEASCPATCSP